MTIESTRESSHDLGERITARAVQVREAATPEERALVESLVARAIEIVDPVERTMERVVVTPPMAAILWLEHNGFNRDWDPKTTAQYAALMEAGKWKTTSQSVYALYGRSGDVADASHRLPAQVMAGVSLDVYFCLGMSKEDVAALDCGRVRTPWHAAKLIGVSRAEEKQSLLTGFWHYLKTVGIDTDAVSKADIHGVAMKIKEHDGLLARALEIGSATSVSAEDPIVSDKFASRIAVILLHCGWDKEKVIDLLSEIQTENFGSDTSPLVYAREHIRDHSKPADIWGPPQAVAVIIKAMMMTADGVEIASARQQARIRQIIGAAKLWPDPRVQEFAETEAAE